MPTLNLRLRRLVRTPYSEQLTLYKGDRRGESTIVGKIDLHFTADGVFGTLLIWDPELLAWEEADLDAYLRGLIEDLVEPQGMADVYAVECFTPALDTYRFFTNAAEEDAEEADEEDEPPAAEEPEDGGRTDSEDDDIPAEEDE